MLLHKNDYVPSIRSYGPIVVTGPESFQVQTCGKEFIETNRSTAAFYGAFNSVETRYKLESMGANFETFLTMRCTQSTCARMV